MALIVVFLALLLALVGSADAAGDPPTRKHRFEFYRGDEPVYAHPDLGEYPWLEPVDPESIEVDGRTLEYTLRGLPEDLKTVTIEPDVSVWLVYEEGELHRVTVFFWWARYDWRWHIRWEEFLEAE